MHRTGLCVVELLLYANDLFAVCMIYFLLFGTQGPLKQSQPSLDMYGLSTMMRIGLTIEYRVHGISRAYNIIVLVTFITSLLAPNNCFCLSGDANSGSRDALGGPSNS